MGRAKRKNRNAANWALKVRIHPDERQRAKIANTFGCCRKVWNLMLDDAKDGKLTTTPAAYKKDPRYAYLKDVDSLALCNVQQNLEQAFSNHADDPDHFNAPVHKCKKLRRRTDEDGKPIKPRPRVGKRSYTTNLVNGNVEVGTDAIKLPKLGWIPANVHREVPQGYRLKSVTVSENAAEQYFASILFEYDFAAPTPVKPVRYYAMDYLSPHFYVDADGEPSDHPKPYRKNLAKLKKLKRELSRMQPGSNNHRKQKKRIGKLEVTIANQRKDWIEKESTRIANEYDAVCIESLDMRAQARSLNFGKAVHDNAWGMFRTRLEQKLDARGKYLVEIDKWFPSSRLCRECGSVNRELALGDAEWTCPTCGTHHVRDPYAAENICIEGKRVLEERLALGTA